jgi:hypothetical protein
LPFLQVASEIIRAAEKIKEKRRHLDFHPFVVERRNWDGSSGFLGTWIAYLRNNDIRWSGYDGLKDNEDGRQRFATRLEALLDADAAFPKEDFALWMSHMLQGWEDVADAASDVASYFTSHNPNRMIQNNPGPNIFKQSFDTFLLHLQSERVRESGDEDVEALADFAKEIKKANIALSSSSPVMAFADKELVGPSRDAMYYLINYSYLTVVSRAGANELSTTPLGCGAGPVHDFVHRLVTEVHGAPDYCGDIDFKCSPPADHALTERLTLQKQEDWDPLWQSVIALAVSDEWKSCFDNVRREYQRGLGGTHLANTEAYQKLNDLLEQNCPGLSIRMSGLEQIGRRLVPRLGLNLSTETYQRLDDLAGRGLRAGLVGGFVEIIFPASSLLFKMLATGLGGLLKSEKAGELWPDALNIDPFSQRGWFSDRTTLLDVRRHHSG